MNQNKTEQELYPHIKNWLEEQLKPYFDSFHLEITANKKFSDVLKGQIKQGRDIIFSFLKEAPPDITGFVRGGFQSEFVVVEIKNKKIKLDDIYQIKKYADLFDAKYAILVSTEEIPEEIIRLSKIVFNLLHLSHYSKRLVLVYFNHTTGNSLWLPDNPFIKK